MWASRFHLKRTCGFTQLNFGDSNAARSPAVTEIGMSCALRTFTLVTTALLVLLGAATERAAAAPTVWSGLSHLFERSTDFDSSLAANQDRITPNVWITRDVTLGIYNRKVEDFYDRTTNGSPAGTLWATKLNNPNVVDLPEVATDGIRSANFANLTFSTWRDAFQGGVGALPGNLLANDAVVHLLAPDDIYLEVRFTAWGGSGVPSFSYLRSVLPGDFNGDGAVNAADYTVWRNTLGQTPARPGDGADIDQSGKIDLGDYTFWKNHYGNSLAGAGAGLFAGASVPEPTSLSILAIASFLLASCKGARNRR
jgi:hypothetical protein